MEKAKNYRLRELDFLRGIAIILVLFRHQRLFDFTQCMGWIGVDLFFVLSGFLVSGLLFKEYQKYGNIRPKLFLIRRGFKIYPLYYLTYVVYLLPLYASHKLEWQGILADLVFLQNYILGWGFAYMASWSLAVEEHFYFGFALMMLLGLRYRFFDFKTESKKITHFEATILATFVICLLMRIVSNVYADDPVRHFSMTHLRIDSLLAGVFVSYQYYFRREVLAGFIKKYQKILLLLALLLVSFTPFLNPMHSFFVRTFGFSFLYVAFAIVLAYFLTNPAINTTLDKLFAKFTVDAVGRIGLASYSIYIIHTFVNYAIGAINRHYFAESVHYAIVFFVTSAISISAGIVMTEVVEKYFLKLRDKWYPSRIN